MEACRVEEPEGLKPFALVEFKDFVFPPRRIPSKNIGKIRKYGKLRKNNEMLRYIYPIPKPLSLAQTYSYTQAQTLSHLI